METNLSRSSPAQMAMAAQPKRERIRKKFFCHLTSMLYLPERVKRPFSMIRIAGKSWRGIESIMAIEYNAWTDWTKWLCWGKFKRITVWVLDPKVAYDKAPREVKRTVIPIMTPVNTLGNFSGSFIDSVMGIINPIPSNVNTIMCGAGTLG
jgi:hypothetical protein